VQLNPNIRYVDLCACVPGELFRPPWASSPLCVLMSDHEDKHRFAVVLQGNDDRPYPFFVQCAQEASMVAAFGHDYQIEIDPSGPSDLRNNKLWEVNGAIHVIDEKWLLRVNPAQGLWNYQACYFDLMKARMAEGPRTTSAIFAKWSLRLPAMNNQPAKSMFEFVHREAT
jgi:hypothetical protein